MGEDQGGCEEDVGGSRLPCTCCPPTLLASSPRLPAPSLVPGGHMCMRGGIAQKGRGVKSFMVVHGLRWWYTISSIVVDGIHAVNQLSNTGL